MLCLEVLLDEHLLARAGGKDVEILFVELSGGREGPIGLTVHGLSKEGDRHLMWVDEAMKSAAVVTFNVLEESFADSEPPVLKRVKPIPTKRKELKMDVEINDQHQCRAQLGDLEGVAAWIEWRKDARYFTFNVKSVTCGEDGYTAEQEWCAANLGVGDSTKIHVWSENDEQRKGTSTKEA